MITSRLLPIWYGLGSQYHVERSEICAGLIRHMYLLLHITTDLTLVVRMYQKFHCWLQTHDSTVHTTYPATVRYKGLSFTIHVREGPDTCEPHFLDKPRFWTNLGWVAATANLMHMCRCETPPSCVVLAFGAMPGR